MREDSLPALEPVPACAFANSDGSKRRATATPLGLHEADHDSHVVNRTGIVGSIDPATEPCNGHMAPTPVTRAP